MEVALCQNCGAELLPPDFAGVARCGSCCSASDALASSPASEAARIAMTDDGVLALLRQHFSGVDSMYLCPSIPGKKELAARGVHVRHLPSNERVLALFDDTVFGSGDEGFLVTSQRLCWRNASGRAQTIEWQHIDPDRMYADRGRLVVGAGFLEISGDESVTLACEQAFHVLAFSARVCSSAPTAAHLPSGVVLSNVSPDDTGLQPIAAQPGTRPSDHPTYRPIATPAPPNGVTYASYIAHASSQGPPSFACWHCHTPLHWNTPQCARCQAMPTLHGWARTG